MKVLKFGGTSVGTPASLRNVSHIIDSLEEPAVIVVSALGGLTDKLIATAHLAAGGDMAYLDEMKAIRERHHDVIAEVIDPSARQDVLQRIDSLLDELARNYDGIALLGDLPPRTLDVVVSFGERMSSIIVSAMTGAAHLNSPDFIKTEKWFDKNIADTELTGRLIRSALGASEGKTVIGGFISTDRDTGEITNLGRGGSDYTAALVAAALNAEVLEIWTDVDGFMTADPRIVPDAYVVDHMTFIESMELCSFGAKVIYPPTIYPVFHKNIPIRILNTFRPEAPGTWITDSPRPGDIPLKGISAIKDTALLHIFGDFAFNVAEINTRTFNALAKNGISVFLVKQPGEDSDFAFAVGGNYADAAVKVIRDEFAPELISGEISDISMRGSLAILAMVGENIQQIPGINGRLFNTLERGGIPVLASSTGASQTTITFVIEEKLAPDALRLVHSSFFH